VGMLVEKGLGKVEKLLGGDAIEIRWYEMPVYEYTLERECSSVTVVGHGFEWDAGEVVVYKATNEGWARATVYPIGSSDMAMKSPFACGSGFTTVNRVSGVVDVDERQIGVTEWDIEVDVAAGSIVSVEVATEVFE